jgi:hypothetical protein
MPLAEGLKRAVSNYLKKHYVNVHLRRELHSEMKSLADDLGLSVPELIKELFLRYGEKLASELRPPAPAPGPTKIPRPAKTLLDFVGGLTVEVGGQRFTVSEREWADFDRALGATSDPSLQSLLYRIPPRLRALAQALARAGALHYDAGERRWRLSPSVRVSRAEGRGWRR